MRLARGILLVMLAFTSNCTKPGKKSGPQTPPANTVDKNVAPNTPPPTVEYVANLFYHSRCGTNPCPARDELHAITKVHPDVVAMAAIDVMDDPRLMQGQSVGYLVTTYLDNWLRSGPRDTAKAAAGQGLEHLVTHGNDDMRSWAVVTLAEYNFPSAKRILIAEIENPAREAADRLGGGKTLGRLTHDFNFIRAWLTGDNPAHWLGALGMLWTFGPDGYDAAQTAIKRDLLIALGKRPNLPGEVVAELAEFYGQFLQINPYDADIIALATRWSKHPDPAAAYEMEKILGWYANKPKRQPTP